MKRLISPKDLSSRNIFNFKIADIKCVAAVKCLPVLYGSIVYISYAFGINGLILNNSEIKILIND